MDGYTTREDQIKDNWARYGSRVQWDFFKMPTLCIAARHRLYPYMPTDAESAPVAPSVDTLRYTFESGTMNGTTAYRIVCEGVVVEEGRL